MPNSYKDNSLSCCSEFAPLHFQLNSILRWNPYKMLPVLNEFYYTDSMIPIQNVILKWHQKLN